MGCLPASEMSPACFRGLMTKEIAGALHISPYTVQDHLESIFDKTGARSRAELVGQVFLEQSPTTRRGRLHADQLERTDDRPTRLIRRHRTDTPATREFCMTRRGTLTRLVGEPSTLGARKGADLNAV